MRRIMLAGLIMVMLAGCGAASNDGANGNAERGKQIYYGETVLRKDNLQACIDCHATTAAGTETIGQPLHDIGARAGSVVAGQSAVEYLRTSILEPDALLTGNYQEGIMPRNYKDLLSQQDLNDVISYLLTLQGAN